MSDAETLINWCQVSKRFGTADRADDIVVLKRTSISACVPRNRGHVGPFRRR